MKAGAVLWPEKAKVPVDKPEGEAVQAASPKERTKVKKSVAGKSASKYLCL